MQTALSLFPVSGDLGDNLHNLPSHLERCATYISQLYVALDASTVDNTQQWYLDSWLFVIADALLYGRRVRQSAPGRHAARLAQQHLARFFVQTSSSRLRRG